VWDSLSPAWQACLEEGWSAYCAGTFPLGAVLVDGDGRIRARGRNQIHGTVDGTELMRNRELAHAELIALFSCERDNINASWALYALLEPCPLCMGALYMSGVRQLHFAARDPFAGSTDLLGATPYMARKRIRVFQSDAAGLEALVVSINIDFNVAHRGDNAHDFSKRWRSAFPKAFGIGEALSRSGQLRAMRTTGASAREVVDELARLIEVA